METLAFCVKIIQDRVLSYIAFGLVFYMPEILFFPYFGPNRHTDCRVVEFRLDFNGDKETDPEIQPAETRRLLLEAGILGDGERFPRQAPAGDRFERYSSLLVQTALLFQIKTNHRVEFSSVSCDPQTKRCVALMEHEDAQVGMAAAKLAAHVMSEGPGGLREAWWQFSRFALGRVLPFETEAIIDGARRRNIPFFQLEREPLAGRINTGARVRPNGLLMLGHGVNQHILDGTFCIDWAGDHLKAMLRNPGQRVALMEQLGIPVSRRDTGGDTRLYRVLVVNRNTTALIKQASGVNRVVDGLHESLARQAVAISERLGLAPIVLTLQTPDVTQPLGEVGGAATDFELAPDLYQLLGSCEDGEALLASAADDLLDWLFPGHASARIPMVAVTGTNGKTTTVRMLRQVFQQGGYKPGMVCTDGIFLDQKKVFDDDNSTFMGHARVLTSRQVDAAVLETHHRGIAVHGFAFQHCDVAVCLNVTEEHLAEGEIETLEEMVGIKRALVERASHVAILFADDANCLGMIPFMRSERICLVSMQRGVEELAEASGGQADCFCVLESVAGKEWIVLYDAARRLPVMPVMEIPATFDGTARMNVSNAMHAIAAGFFSRLSIDRIRLALSAFTAGTELTPGRLNVFDDLPFRVITDFAHNPDGVEKICEFTDLQEVTGRKKVAFAGLRKRPDDLNRKIAQAIAGHFDFYFCKDYEPSDGSSNLRYTGPFMQQVLIEEGVAREATTVLTWGRDVIFRIFDSCKPGDLLLLLVGHAEKGKIAGFIEEYRNRQAHNQKR